MEYFLADIEIPKIKGWFSRASWKNKKERRPTRLIIYDCIQYEEGLTDFVVDIRDISKFKYEIVSCAGINPNTGNPSVLVKRESTSGGN